MALAVLTLSPDRRIVASDPVLRAAQWRALRDASELIQLAEEAVAQARAEAVRQATAEATAAARQTDRQVQQTLLLKALSLQVEYERLQRELSEQFTDTVMSCLRSLLAGPLPAAFLERVVASSRHWVGEAPSITLSVSPVDEAAARATAQATNGRVTVRVAPDLQVGQCLVETAFGRLQASLETQLDALREALERWWSAPQETSVQPAAAAPRDAAA